MKKLIIILFFYPFFCFADEPFWEYVGGPETGTANYLANDSRNNIYTCSDGGVFISIDKGDNWKKISSFKTSDIAIDSSDNIVVGDRWNYSNKLLLSTNYGTSWSDIILPKSGYMVEDIKFLKIHFIYFLI